MRLATQSGVSLVEVLTAVLMLALAVAGAAGLQWRALRGAHGAGLQSEASRVAADMAENIRAFDQWSRRQGRDNPLGSVALDSPLATEQAAPSCFAAACAPEQLAAFVINESARRMWESLPEARMRVCRDASPWDEARKALRWECPETGSSEPLVIKLGWRTREDPEADTLPLLALVVLP